MNHGSICLPPFDSTAVRNAVGSLTGKYGFVRSKTIGASLRGIPLTALIFGSGQKRILYVGTHHGSERITSALLLDFVSELCEAVAGNGRCCGYPVRDVLDSRTLIVIPMLNPDGADIAAHGSDAFPERKEMLCSLNGGNDFTHWQANARGVDLNHNYDAGFAEYKEIERMKKIRAGATRYSGEFPESEPETAALCRYIRSLDRLAAIMTFHSQGEEIFWKSSRFALGGALTLSRLSGYRLSEAEGLTAYGGLTDWASKCGIRSYTIECGRGKNPLPYGDIKHIYARLRNMLFVAPTVF